MLLSQRLSQCHLKLRAQENFQDTYHSIVYDFLFNQESFEERRMSLADVSVVLVLAHARLARGADCHAE